MKHLLAAIAIASLAACAQQTTQATVDTDISVAVNALATAERAATLYIKGCRIVAPTKPPCSDVTIAGIKAAATKAHNALKLAEADHTLIAAAIDAARIFAATVPSQ